MIPLWCRLWLMKQNPLCSLWIWIKLHTGLIHSRNIILIHSVGLYKSWRILCWITSLVHLFEIIIMRVMGKMWWRMVRRNWMRIKMWMTQLEYAKLGGGGIFCFQLYSSWDKPLLFQSVCHIFTTLKPWKPSILDNNNMRLTKSLHILKEQQLGVSSH